MKDWEKERRKEHKEIINGEGEVPKSREDKYEKLNRVQARRENYYDYIENALEELDQDLIQGYHRIVKSEVGGAGREMEDALNKMCS